MLQRSESLSNAPRGTTAPSAELVPGRRAPGPAGYDAQREALRPQSGTGSPGRDASLRLAALISPVRVLAFPPANVLPDQVMDLTDPATVLAELGQTTARFVHVVVGGQDTWLDLGASGNAMALASLTGDMVDSKGQLRVGLELTTWFRWDGTDIVAGVSRTDVQLRGGVATAQGTLDESNRRRNKRDDDDALGGRMDALWDFMNGGSTDLNASGEKPGAWFNGIRLEGDRNNPTVSTKRSPKDTRKGAVPRLSLADYRQMLVRDFNYNSAITTFQQLGGLPVFTEALLQRHPTGDRRTLEVVAREVWSYATTGMDTRGVTDIHEMQGYLYVFDPEIQLSSDANTELTGEFNAGTSEAPLMLPRGDGKHGRSTILTTRHLLANVDFETLVPTRTPTVPDPVLFGDNDRFVRDDSPSMAPVWNLMRDGVDRQLQRGAYDPTGTKPSVSSNVVGTFDHDTLELQGAPASSNLNTAGRVVNFGQLLSDAYERVYPTKSATDARMFVGLLGLTGPLGSYFSVSRGVYTLNADVVQAELADVHGPSTASNTHGADGESAIKEILASLLYDPSVSTPFNGVMPRLNSVADEGEQGLEYVELAKTLAKELGVEVRLIAVPTNSSSAAATFNPATDIAIIPLESIEIRNTGTGLLVVCDVTQGGVTTVGATIPVQYDTNNRGTFDPNQPFRQAWAPLQSGQSTNGKVQ